MNNQPENKIISPEIAASLIADRAIVSVSSSSGLACPDTVLQAIGERFDRTGHPRGLTTLHPIAAGDMYGIKGVDHLAKPGLLSRILAGSYPSGPSSLPEPAIWRMIRDNAVAAYNVPSGILFDLHREAARTGLGVLSQVGIETYADPDQQGCRMNDASPEPVVKKITFEGREWLYYLPIRPGVAIIRGTTADPAGNISMEQEGAYLGACEQALAVRNLGGIVIAQVKRVAENGSRRAQEIRVAGHLVDYVVVAPDQRQTTETDYDPAISGEVRRPLDQFAPVEWGIEKLIARRAAMEVRRGETINVGFGVSALVPRILLEEGLHGAVTWLTEQGAVGGLPLLGFQFGCAANADAITPSPYQFTLFQGGGADRSMLSFLEIDRHGNVNVTRLAATPHVTAGAGGFVDITTGIRRLVFSGRFDAVGSKVEIRDGKLCIGANGRIVKLVDQVDHISFRGARGRERGQRVTVVTERCVLRFVSGQWMLTETAPGIDPRTDVLERLPFPVRVADDHRNMDQRLFDPAPMGLELMARESNPA